jgi:hypothetical protein
MTTDHACRSIKKNSNTPIQEVKTMTEVEKLQKENEALRRQVEELKRPVVHPVDLPPDQKLKLGREANHKEWLKQKGKL